MKVDGFFASGNMKLLSYALVVVSTTLILVGIWQGNRQDQTFAANFNTVQAVDDLVQRNRLEDANQQLRHLMDKVPNSFFLNYKYGWILARQGKYDDALNYLTKARELNPFEVLDQSYLITSAQVFYFQGDLLKARAYLAKSKELNQDKQLTLLSEKMIVEIDKKNVVK